MDNFYNRKYELAALDDCWQADGAQLALLYGRRRLGKTFLLQKFLHSAKPHCYFLAAQTSFQTSIAELAGALLAAAPDRGYTEADLATLPNILRFVGTLAGEERFALVLDEFQYLLEQDPSLPSQIQAWWDMEGIRSKVFLILCGSHSGIMEGLGGHNAPLFGRFTFRYRLTPMAYKDIALFYDGSNYSIREKLMAFGILGGTPRYHALFDCRKSLASNICRNILSPAGLLRNETEVIMLSSRLRDAGPYNAVLKAIANGCTRPNEIKQAVGVTSAQLTFYLRTLMELEWITREYPFDENSDRRAIYRISDHFVRFWYRFVARLRSQLEFDNHLEVYRSGVLPYLDDYMGLSAFEDICRQYLKIKGAARIGYRINRASRYWSRDGSLELDVMAELSDGSYLFGECKWSSAPLDTHVYYSLRSKVSRMPEKYRTNPRYILFSQAGFDDKLKSVAESDGLILVSGEDLLL